MGSLRSNFFLFLFSTLLCAVGAEGLLRFAGQKPWEVSGHYSQVPVVTAPSASLGWVNRPGEYSYSLTADGKNIVRYTIAEDGRRKITGDDSGEKPEIWIFGCSFSFGWAVTDGEEYAARLAALAPGHRVKNYSVPGYGTFQALLRYEELVKSNKPAPIVVYGFASFHDERNAASFEWLRNIRRNGRGQYWVSTPFAELKNGKLVRHAPVSFTVFPFSEHSDLLTAAQDGWGRFSASGRERTAREVTVALIQQFAETAKKNGSRFLVLALSLPRDGEYYFTNVADPPLEYVDGSRYGVLTPARMVPGDNLHPNAAIHVHWAEKLAAYLRDDKPFAAENAAHDALYSPLRFEGGRPAAEVRALKESGDINGIIERRTSESGDAVITGWVFDKARPENLVALSAVRNEKELTRMIADGTRDDVVQVFKTDEFLRPGFELRVPLEPGESPADIRVLAVSQSGAYTYLPEFKQP